MTDKQIIIDGINLHGNRKDLTGLKVGKLTCLKPVKTGKNKHSEWLCECECGNFKIAQTYRLLSGRIQSCGDCYHTINHYIPMIKELEKQLKCKEQECEELKEELHKNFEEKDILHLIIDRLLEASGYDTNTATAEDFEDVYEYMRYEQQQLDQLKAENEELKKENELLNVQLESYFIGEEKIIKQLKAKEQECEELRQYHNKCCEENAKKEAEWLEKFNQISIGFYNGDYCNTEHCSLLKAKEQECEELKKCNIYTCGICGNKEDCNKLYKTLAEIKEIAEKLTDDYGHKVSNAKIILQKICEVEE